MNLVVLAFEKWSRICEFNANYTKNCPLQSKATQWNQEGQSKQV